MRHVLVLLIVVGSAISALSQSPAKNVSAVVSERAPAQFSIQNAVSNRAEFSFHLKDQTEAVRALSTSVNSGVATTVILPAVNGASLFNGDHSYTIVVPPDTTQLQVRLTTATANADLDMYLRRDQDVEFFAGAIVADYRSEGPTGSETITVASPVSGTYYIAFVSYALNTTVESTLTATTTSGTPTGNYLTSGTPANVNLPAIGGPTLFRADFGYRIVVPPGTNQLRVETASPNGDVNLYVRFGQEIGFSGGDVIADYYSEISGPGDESISITSPQPGTYFIGLGLFTLNAAVSVLLTATNTTSAEEAPRPASYSLIAPHFINGPEWSSFLFLSNISPTVESFTVRFYNQGGSLRSVSIVGLGTTDTISGTLSPGQTVVYETMYATTLQGGWASITPASGSSTRLSGFVVFRYRAPGAADTEAIVTLGNTSDFHLVLLYDQIAGYTTGIAVANPYPTAQIVDVSVRNEIGAPVGTFQIDLAPLEQQAFFLTERLSAAAGTRGSMTLRGPNGFAVLGIRVSPLGPFTSFPALK